ncbi:hypothetical protein [Streptacidiphilus cavernicola]|uniref:Uncharacterized protein n=1 Tax=Streptacidiphilus cavernicola TaxID=3342716 RepID=A0ABV6VY55_9ACTN
MAKKTKRTGGQRRSGNPGHRAAAELAQAVQEMQGTPFGDLLGHLLTGGAVPPQRPAPAPDRVEIQADDPENTIWIVGNPRLEPDLTVEPTCGFQWADQSAVVSTATVRQMATDLLACASWADMTGLLRHRLQLDPEMANAVLLDMIRSSGHTRDHFGDPGVMTFSPGAVRQRPEGLVLITGLGRNTAISPDGARQMAASWLETAMSVTTDEATSFALRELVQLDTPAIEGVMQYQRLLHSMKVPGQDRMHRDELVRLKSILADMPEDPTEPQE